MVLTHQYLRYAPLSRWGLVATGPALLLPDSTLITATLESLTYWDARRNEKLLEVTEGGAAISCLRSSGESVAAGYTDGAVRVFPVKGRASNVLFNGHTSAVNVLLFDGTGGRLCSGAQDTDIVVWDVVGQAGLFRLRGHKGPVTDLAFLPGCEVLVSASRDTTIKLWCLDSQHCFETLPNGRDEVTSVAVVGEDRILSSSLRLWSFSPHPGGKRKAGEKVVQCELLGSIVGEKGKRLVVSGGWLFSQAKTLQVYKILTVEERAKLLKKKKKKGGEVEALGGDEEVRLVKSIKVPGHLRWVEVRDGKELCCVFSDNRLQVYKLGEDFTLHPSHSLHLFGHRADVRSVCFTSDSSRVLSVSDGSAKVWSCRTRHSVSTVECGTGLCAVMAPGDQYAVVGTKQGSLQLLDLVGGSVSKTVTAHTGSVWDLAMRPDRRAFVSGSADKDVKFWEFTLEGGAGGGKGSLGLHHAKTLRMEEEVLGVRYSPSSTLLAVALLDCTVKVLFTDSLKLFISLYGHKLPVTTLDISSDSTLIITGSADKNIKIWGLDFGDCHRSIFAHDDAVMRVLFVPKTHLFFSVGKDRTLKQWDADNFEHVQTLTGHQAEVWGLDVSGDGEFVVTSSHDKSLRLWERTDEPLVLEDERETAREKEYEETLVEGGEGEGVETTGKKTMETLKGAERIMEAIQIWREDQAVEDGDGDRNVILTSLNISASAYVLDVLGKVRPSEVEEALLVLPFHYVVDLVGLIAGWLAAGQRTELCVRCLVFLLKVHHNPIVAHKPLVPVMEELLAACQASIGGVRDVIGFNLAAMRLIQLDLKENSEHLFADLSGKVKSVKKKKRAVLKTMS